MEAIKVTNGCSGGCCENFTLPYYLEDLKEMLTAREAGKSVFIDKLGDERKVYGDPGLAMMVDMLIPLGHCGDNNPNARPEDAAFDITTWIAKEGIVTQEDWNKNQSELKHWYVMVDGKWTMRTFTCKHFDTINRTCTNYENRPPMCHHFGENCHYKGCTYTAVLKQLRENEAKLRQEELVKEMRAQGCTCVEPQYFTHESGCKIAIALNELNNVNDLEEKGKSVHGC